MLACFVNILPRQSFPARTRTQSDVGSSLSHFMIQESYESAKVRSTNQNVHRNCCSTNLAGRGQFLTLRRAVATGERCVWARHSEKVQKQRRKSSHLAFTSRATATTLQKLIGASLSLLPTYERPTLVFVRHVLPLIRRNILGPNLPPPDSALWRASPQTTPQRRFNLLSQTLT